MTLETSIRFVLKRFPLRANSFRSIDNNTLLLPKRHSDGAFSSPSGHLVPSRPVPFVLSKKRAQETVCRVARLTEARPPPAITPNQMCFVLIALALPPAGHTLVLTRNYPVDRRETSSINSRAYWQGNGGEGRDCEIVFLLL